MAKKPLRAKNQPLMLVIGAALFVALVAGAYYMYQTNFAPTDSSASDSAVLKLNSSSISKTSLSVGETFTMSCNYDLATESASLTDKGIITIGEGITCTRNVSSDKTSAQKNLGKAVFTCTANTVGKFAVGCGIAPGTQTVVGMEKTCKTVSRTGTDSRGNSYTEHVTPGMTDGKCPNPNGNPSNDGSNTGPIRTALMGPVEYFASSKVVDYITVGAPTGVSNCVVPAYLGGTLNPTNISLAAKNKSTYNVSCGYMLKTAIPVTSEKATPTNGNSTCAAMTQETKTIGAVTLSSRMTSTCTPKAGLVVGNTIQTSCDFVASTVNSVPICAASKPLPTVTMVK